MKFPILRRKSHKNTSRNGKSEKNDNHHKNHHDDEEHIITMPDHSNISMTDGSHTTSNHHHHHHDDHDSRRRRRRSKFDELGPQEKIHLLEECAQMGASGTASYIFKMMQNTPYTPQGGDLEDTHTAHSQDKPKTPRAA